MNCHLKTGSAIQITLSNDVTLEIKLAAGCPVSVTTAIAGGGRRRPPSGNSVVP